MSMGLIGLVPQGDLTIRQHELVSYLALGLTNAMIGAAMGVSPNTVRNQLATLFTRFDVSNRAELLATCIARQSVRPQFASGTGYGNSAPASKPIVSGQP